MKTMESIISARASQLSKYKADKEKAKAKATEFSQTVADSLMVDMPMASELKDAAKEYRKTNSAIELAYTPEYKDKFRKEDKSIDKLAVREETVELCDAVITSAEPLTAELISKVKPLFSAISKRMEKQTANYDIQIKDAEKDILLYNLIVATQANPVHPAGFTEFVENLLKEEPKKSGEPAYSQLGMDYMSVLEHFGMDAGKAGKDIAKAGLTVGRDYKLVAKA